MCGKFTAQASWSEVVDFSQPLTESGGGESGDEGGNDEIVTYRVGGLLPVIVWNAETRARRVVKMRWGFPDPRDWRRPRPAVVLSIDQCPVPDCGSPRGLDVGISRGRRPAARRSSSVPV